MESHQETMQWGLFLCPLSLPLLFFTSSFFLSLKLVLFVILYIQIQYSSAQQPSSYILSVLAAEKILSDSNPSSIILEETI